MVDLGREETALAPFYAHGGALERAQRLFPHAQAPWIDLSTGINPHAYPFSPLAADVWTRLPGEEAHAALIDAARQAYGVREEDMLIAAPGTEALIALLPSLFPDRRAAILGPTYGGYQDSWRRAGRRLEEVKSLEAAQGADLLILVNPNNPDGRLLSRDRLRQSATSLAARGGFLIVDEAFADFIPEQSLVADGLPPATLVLRSFGKAYGLAGLRLGFAIASAPLARRLEGMLGAWAVSGPALVLGKEALSNPVWRAAMRERLLRDAARLDRLLQSAGLELMGGTPLFRLAACGHGQDLFLRLAEAGILVRPFSNRREWLRFGIPADRESWERLAAALEADPAAA